MFELGGLGGEMMRWGVLKRGGCGIGKWGDERLFGGGGRLWEVMRWLMGWEREGMGDGGLFSLVIDWGRVGCEGDDI